MMEGSVELDGICVVASRYDQSLSSFGWSFPCVNEMHRNLEEALHRFNELVADPTVAKAAVNMTFTYNTASLSLGSVTRTTSSNTVTIAHYDHKASVFENFMTRNNFWEANRGLYKGIQDCYHADLPQEGPKSHKPSIKLNTVYKN